MTTIEFFAKGEPKGQPRPRAFARKMGGKYVARVFDSGTAENWKSAVARDAIHHTPPAPIEGPVAVHLSFFFPRPRSHYRTGKHSHELRPDAPSFHVSKPDSDNLAKAILDCLTQLGGFWKDDSQVSHLRVTKYYGPTPGATIHVCSKCP